MAQYYDASSSPFYRSRYPQAPVLDKGSLGPPIFGPYQQRWDPKMRQWYRPDGSRAQLAGLGDMTLPDMDLTTEGRTGPRELVDKQTFVVLAAALVLGLGGGWALQKHYKLVGYAMLGLGGVAAVAGIFKLKQNVDAQAAYAMWNTPRGGAVAGWGMR